MYSVLLEHVNIFANPIAGRGHGKAMAARIQKRLLAEGYDVTTTFDKPDTLTPRIINDMTRAIIVIGGDGTLRAVVGRLLELGLTIPPILPVPLGTANLMAKHLGFRLVDELLEEDVANAIRRLNLRMIDAAEANGKLFLLIAGVGFDAQVVHDLDKIRTGPIHMLDYVKPALLALRDYQFPTVRVSVDGTQVWRSAPAIVFVGNVREYGTGFSMLPFAQPDDGLLDICILPCESKSDLLQWFFQAAIEMHIWSDRVKMMRGKRVTIDSSQPMPVQVDGDPAGFTPLKIQLMQKRLPFIAGDLPVDP